jgi:nucleolar complex protein 2
MVKTTKRSRKFVAKGGVKAMLDKNQTFTKKGKVRGGAGGKRRGGDVDPEAAAAIKRREGEAAKRQHEARRRRRDEEDMVGEANLADMDIDTFFKSVAEGGVDGSDDDESSSNGSGDEQQKQNDDFSRGSDSDDNDDDDSDDDSSLDEEEAERRMKEEMMKLSENDPEFHKYLKDNEQSLLEFGDEDDYEYQYSRSGDEEDQEEESSEYDDESEEEESPKEEKTKKKETNEPTPAVEDSPHIVLTPKLLLKYEQSAFRSHGIKGLKRIISAYKTACHMSDANAEDEGHQDKGRKAYHIEDSAVFDRLMASTLRHCHEEFRYHLLGAGSGVESEDSGGNKKKRDDDDDDDETDDDSNSDANDAEDLINKPVNPKLLAKSKRWTQVGTILQSFLKSTLHLLSEAKEPELVTFVLKNLAYYIPFMTAYPRVAKSCLKTLTKLWSASLDTSEDYQVVRLNAFIRIRQMALTQPFPFIEQCLKSTYLAYAKRAKFATAASVTSLLPTITFMGNCIVELYSLDYASSYQHAFVYIRQLALHLRSAIQKKTPEAFRVVYCWQYIHCLKLWTAVLCSAAGQSDDEAQLMRSLIFPLTEVIFGVIRLVPTTRHLPLRLHCVRFLQQIAASSEQYIPTTSVLLEALDLKELYMKPKRVDSRGKDIRGIRLPLILKLPKEGALRTTEQLDACLGEIFVLLNREVDLYRYSPGFPEFTVRICQRLRKYSKETKNGKYRAYSRGCIELCEKYSAEATKARSKLNEAPKDIKRLEALKPSNVPSMKERYESSIAKEKRLEQASQPALSDAAKKRARSEAAKEKEEVDDDDEPKSKKKKQKKKKVEVNQKDLENIGALAEDDEIQEGIDWDSDDE